MSWENILKLKTKQWHKFVYEIMSDKQSRTARQIVEILSEVMSTGRRTGAYTPRASEVSHYLRVSGKYRKYRKNQWIRDDDL